MPIGPFSSAFLSRLSRSRSRSAHTAGGGGGGWPVGMRSRPRPGVRTSRTGSRAELGSTKKRTPSRSSIAVTAASRLRPSGRRRSHTRADGRHLGPKPGDAPQATREHAHRPQPPKGDACGAVAWQRRGVRAPARGCEPIGGRRGPAQVQASQSGGDPPGPCEDQRGLVGVVVRGDHRRAGERRGDPPGEQDRDSQEDRRTALGFLGQVPRTSRNPSVPSTIDVGPLREAGRGLLGAHAHAGGRLEAAAAQHPTSAWKASRSVASSPPNMASRAPRVPQEPGGRRALVDAGDRVAAPAPCVPISAQVRPAGGRRDRQGQRPRGLADRALAASAGPGSVPCPPA